MHIFISFCLFSVGIIHLMPSIGLLGSDRLFQLYSIEIMDPNLLILMRHRAMLFGLFGGYFVFASLNPAHQWVAIFIGLMSTVSYVVLMQLSESYNFQLKQVLIADFFAIGLLVVAAILKWRISRM